MCYCYDDLLSRGLKWRLKWEAGVAVRRDLAGWCSARVLMQSVQCI